MMKLKPAMVAREVVDGSQTAVDDFESGIVSQETDMTGRLFGSIAQALNGRRIGNLTWKAYTLKSSRGKSAEEKRHGADVLGVLDIQLSDYKTRKGFLLQAKIAEPHIPLSKSEWTRFQGQCRTMLSRTHESFGVIYSRTKGVRFVPANTILEIDRHQLFEAGSRSLFGFFKSHVKCQIGDRNLSTPSVAVLDRIARLSDPDLSDFGVEAVLSMKVSDAYDS